MQVFYSRHTCSLQPVHFKTDLPVISSSLSISAALSPTITPLEPYACSSHLREKFNIVEPHPACCLHLQLPFFIRKAFLIRAGGFRALPILHIVVNKGVFHKPYVQKHHCGVLVWSPPTAQTTEFHPVVTCFEVTDLMVYTKTLSFRKHPNLGNKPFVSAKLILKYTVALFLSPCPVAWNRI